MCFLIRCLFPETPSRVHHSSQRWWAVARGACVEHHRLVGTPCRRSVESSTDTTTGISELPINRRLMSLKSGQHQKGQFAVDNTRNISQRNKTKWPVETKAVDILTPPQPFPSSCTMMTVGWTLSSHKVSLSPATPPRGAETSTTHIPPALVGSPSGTLISGHIRSQCSARPPPRNNDTCPPPDRKACLPPPPPSAPTRLHYHGCGGKYLALAHDVLPVHHLHQCCHWHFSQSRALRETTQRGSRLPRRCQCAVRLLHRPQPRGYGSFGLCDN